MSETAGLDPGVEELLAESRVRKQSVLPRRERNSELLVGGVFLLASTLLAIQHASERDLDPGLAILGVLAYGLASRVQFYAGEGYTVPTQLVFVPMLFVLPVDAVPFLVAAGILVGNVPDYVQRSTSPGRALLALSDSWHVLGPVAVFTIFDVSAPEWSDWPVYLLALGSQFVVDFASWLTREWLGLGISPSLQLSVVGWPYMVDALLSPLGLLAAFASQSWSYGFLLLVPLLVLLTIFARERNARIVQAIELSSAYKGTALLLGDVVEADDEYTGAHSRGVLELALEVADSMGLPAYARRQVEFSALLHDVGKIHIPKEIINKPGKLDDQEWELMKTHTIEGQKILERVGGVLGEVGRIVRSCHERYDGKGYPDGLTAREIPVAARIVFCCDAFNAMTTTRSYRKALPLDVALGELETNAGTQFDPEVVGHIMRIVQHDAHKHAAQSVEAHGVAEPVS